MNKATKSAIEDIEAIHQGVHLALEALVNAKDTRRTEELLRQIDHRLTYWVNNTKEAR